MKIHPLTYLYLFLAFISRSSYYVAFLLFSILHEIGHYLVALYFSFEIEKIMILPFGAFLLLKDLGKHYVYEEIGMLLCGPFINLICFIFFLFIKEPLLAKINIYILIFTSSLSFGWFKTFIIIFILFHRLSKSYANTNKSFTIIYLYFMDYYETNREKNYFRIFILSSYFIS
jgi:hypothetical protein